MAHYYLGGVPCREGGSTGFSIHWKIEPEQVEVGFIPEGNFRSAEPAFQHELTNTLCDELRETYPGHAVVFQI